MATFSDALSLGTERLSRAQAQLAQLPRREGPPAPRTLAEALAAVNAREEEKRRKDGRRESKNKGGAKAPGGTTPPAHQFPGSVPGVDREPSAFWMIVEDYCRDVTQEDLELLLPEHPDPTTDPLLRVPPLGRAFDADDGDDEPSAAPKAIEAQLNLDREARRSRAATKAPREELAPEQLAEPQPPADPHSCLLDQCTDVELSTVLQAMFALQVDTHDAALLQSLSNGAGSSTGEAAASPSARRNVQQWLRQQSEQLLARLRLDDGAHDLASAPPPPGPAVGEAEDEAAVQPAEAPAAGDHTGGGASAAAPVEGGGEDRDDDMGERSAPRAGQADELHPLTRMLLARPVPEHVYALVPQPAPHEEPTKPPTHPATPLGALPALPSTPGGEAFADEGVSTPGLPAYRPSNLGPGARGGGSGAGRGNGGAARNRTSVNYSLLAGRKGGSVGRSAAKPPLAAAQEPAPTHPVQTAVAAMVAEGPPDGGVEEAWAQLAGARELIAAAPDDEVLAEMIACQAELLAQVALNRSLTVPLLDALEAELPRQAAARAARQRMAQDMRNIILRTRETKRQAQREKRAEAQAAAAQAIQASVATSPRGRWRGRPKDGEQRAAEGSEDESEEEAATAAPPASALLVDSLAERDDERDACCGVCGDGTSFLNNPILFCERCDVAVHQKCYHVTTVPQGDWLCWPCREYEEEQRRQGLAQDVIRPPRWATADATGARLLEGGSRSVRCALCPVGHGTFRKTTDGRQWVHQACGLWHPEVDVAEADMAEVVSGLQRIDSKRREAPCTLCGRTEGATIKCNFGHCMTAYHPLCARNAGQYLAMREAGARTQYRSYCALHSCQQKEKDEAARAERSGRVHKPLGDDKIKGKGDKKDRKVDAKRRAALQALAERESELELLHNVRLELESLRLLVERISKREKLRTQLVKARRAKYGAMLAAALAAAPPQRPAPSASAAATPPDASLLRQQQPAASSARPGRASGVASPERTRKRSRGVARGEPPQPQASQGSQPKQQTGAPPRPSAGNGDEATQPRRKAGGSRAQKDGDGDDDGGGSPRGKQRGGRQDSTPAAKPSRNAKDAGGSSGKRAGGTAAKGGSGGKAGGGADTVTGAARGTRAKASAAAAASPVSAACASPRARRAAAAADAADAPAPPSGRTKRTMDAEESGAAPRPPKRLRVKMGGSSVSDRDKVLVDRECMMTSGEAEATNTRLPKGYAYVPADVLKPSGPSTRGR